MLGLCFGRACYRRPVAVGNEVFLKSAWKGPLCIQMMCNSALELTISIARGQLLSKEQLCTVRGEGKVIIDLHPVLS